MHLSSPKTLTCVAPMCLSLWKPCLRRLRQGLPVLPFQSFTSLAKEVAVWQPRPQKLLQRSVEFEFSGQNQCVKFVAAVCVL